MPNGSTTMTDHSSLDLVLAHPTESEKRRTWTLNAKNWGGALTLPQYLDREEYLAHIPATRDGGVTHWILVDSTLLPDARPVLATCESLRRPVALALPDGTLKECITHGIGSVFSPPVYRGKGYASTMLRLLGSALKDHQKEEGECPFSILYSDIGKKYYTSLGWKVSPSSHVSLTSLPPTNGSANGHTTATPLTTADFPALVKLDTQYIKDELIKTSKNLKKPTFSLVPDLLTLEWHHLRQSFMTTRLFPSRPAPTINGAVSSGPVGSRVWIYFTRVFYAPLGSPDNTFYILRLVVENDVDSEENAEKLGSVLDMARKEAGEWGLGSVVAWNVCELTGKLLERSGVEHEVVQRENHSIPQLMWYGEGKGEGEDLEWICNEKFGWC
ncbi:putative lysine acetyltransferase [Amylocarpus encephaloides]|uniref:Lysine acetyltransferase n=1 Tax=Amylocarpus encephaloides TaxID=45428 RepID=A0A9P8C1Y8_9HELO|nr:putative lysine acetyltransferase [Amylocarpus encephaloides]